ncbi:MAG: hypothetical protein PHU46_11210 [Rhodocyclaceae bacterium]|nr:hypothetical protein [Rhodocyclaceae bacterium]
MQKALAGPFHAMAMACPARWLAGHRFLFAGAAFGLLAVALLASGLLASLLITDVAPATCIAGRCVAGLAEGGQVALELGVSPSRASEPLSLRVTASGMSVARVEVSMVGVAMNMVDTRAELVRAEDGSWRGELVLPVCSSGPMEWRANVQVRGGWRTYVVPFRFRSGVP